MADDGSSRPLVEGGHRAGLEQRLDIVVAPSHPAAVLMVVSGSTPGRLHSLDRPETYVGRSKDAHIQIDEKSVSGRHAKLINHGGTCYIRDLNSTNGTFVNGQSIHEKELKHGDSVWIGETVFAFFQEGGSENSRTVALAPIDEDVRPHARLAKRPLADAVRGGAVQVDDGASLAENLKTLIRVYRFLGRHKFTLTLFALLGLILGATSIAFVPQPPMASCEMELRPQLKDNPVATDWRQRSDELEYFKAAEANFPNANVVKKTLDQLGEPYDDDQVASIQSRLELKTKALHRYTATYRKAYFDSSSHTAVRFLELYVQNFLDSEIDKVLKVFRAEADNLDTLLKQSQNDLSASDDNLLKFKEQNFGLLPGQSGAVSTRSGLSGRSGQISADLTRKKIELRNLRERLQSEEPIAESKAAATQSYEGALAAVNQRLAEKRASGLGEEHPEVIQLKKQAAELQSLIDSKISAPTTDFERKSSPGYKALRDRVQELEMDVSTASQELGSVHGTLTKVDSVVSKLPQVEAKLNELTLDQEKAKNRNLELTNSWHKAKDQLDTEEKSVHARYEIPIKPSVISPGRMKLGIQRLGGGFGIFLVLGLLVALLKELRQYMREHVATGS